MSWFYVKYWGARAKQAFRVITKYIYVIYASAYSFLSEQGLRE